VIDGLDRLTQVRRAAADYRTQTQQYYDGFRRAIESRTFEDNTPFTAVDTTYDALGRVHSVSNPYRPGDTINWTTTSYDALGE
jgi:hypothetical protein